MKFSLIIGTLNRPWAIKKCIKSLISQSCQDFEIIIIDQSDDKETEKYIASIDNSRIVYRHVDYKGLSRARNDAIKISTGDYFCLIDDDAFYEKKYLEIAREYVGDKSILSGYIFDNIKKGPFAGYKNKYNHKTLSMRMIFRTCPSAALVFPLSLVKEVGGFDEQLGVGTEFSSCEETDLIVRGLLVGYQVKFVKEMKLKHPYPISDNAQKLDYKKRSSYYRGMGALYKKHMKEHIRGLRCCYIEVWIKLMIKRLMPIKYHTHDIKMLIEGLKYGMKNYTR